MSKLPYFCEKEVVGRLVGDLDAPFLTPEEVVAALEADPRAEFVALAVSNTDVYAYRFAEGGDLLGARLRLKATDIDGTWGPREHGLVSAEWVRFVDPIDNMPGGSCITLLGVRLGRAEDYGDPTRIERKVGRKAAEMFDAFLKAAERAPKDGPGIAVGVETFLNSLDIDARVSYDAGRVSLVLAKKEDAP